MDKNTYQTIEEILAQARMQFPVDESVTRTSHLNFERWADKALKDHPGQAR